MPINPAILAQYVSPTFVETGTFLADTAVMARDLGMAVKTCDICPKMVRKAKAKGFDAVCVPSPEFLAQTIPGIDGPITFWLDAHPFTKPMNLTDPRFPLPREIEAIAATLRKGPHVILIDDLRVFSDEDVQTIESLLLKHWPKARLTRIDDELAPGDILACDMRAE